jgi:hypothetical protein
LRGIFFVVYLAHTGGQAKLELIKRFPEQSCGVFQALLKSMSGNALPAFKQALKVRCCSTHLLFW